MASGEAPPTTPPLPKPTALILARDPMTGALLGSLVDVSGFRAVFPEDEEEIEATIARERPDVVLVDCDVGNEDRCIEPVGAYGGVVVLFSPWRSEPEVRPRASRLGLRHFTLPITWIEFRQLLREALGHPDER